MKIVESKQLQQESEGLNTNQTETPIKHTKREYE